MRENEVIKLLFKELIGSETYSFPENGKLDISCSLGVYVIYDPDDIIVHVGRALSGKKGLCQRLNNHLAGKSSFVKKYLDKDKFVLRRGFRFKFISIENNRTSALLEYLAIGCLCPLHLGLHQKLAK